MERTDEDKLIDEVTGKSYEFGFTTDIESDTLPPGLDESVIRVISAKKNEPEWLLEWRLEAFKVWSDMEEPNWAHVEYEKPDFQAISYYSAPKQKKKLKIGKKSTSKCSNKFLYFKERKSNYY